METEYWLVKEIIVAGIDNKKTNTFNRTISEHIFLK